MTRKLHFILAAVSAFAVAAVADDDPGRTTLDAGAESHPSPELMHGYITPRRQVTIAAPLDGVLMAIDVEEGQVVQEGDVLARLDDRIAQAAVESARADVRRMAEIDTAESEREIADIMLKRLLSTVDIGASSRTEVDEARARALKAHAAYQSAIERRDVARRNLALEEARLEQLSLRAPFDGVIVRRIATPGQMLTSAQEILLLVSLDELQTELHLPLNWYNRLEVGDDVRFRAEAPVNDVISARVRAIEPIIDPATGAFRCRFTIDNPNRTIPAGVKVIPLLNETQMTITDAEDPAATHADVDAP